LLIINASLLVLVITVAASGVADSGGVANIIHVGVPGTEQARFGLVFVIYRAAF
jgi:hypothetical protein